MVSDLGHTIEPVSIYIFPAKIGPFPSSLYIWFVARHICFSLFQFNGFKKLMVALTGSSQVLINLPIVLLNYKNS